MDLFFCTSYQTSLILETRKAIKTQRGGGVTVKKKLCNMASGKLIVVEGLDRAGKTTQIESLIARLAESSIKVEAVKFPERSTTIGQMINAYLNSSATLSDEAIHLLFSANRWELAPYIQRKLQEGVWLVVDRYVYSGAAFSSAKGLDLDWCMAPDRGLPEPDLVIFLDVSASVAEKRGGYGAERYERQEFQAVVKTQFQLLRKPSWAWLSADPDPGTVAESVWSAVVQNLL